MLGEKIIDNNILLICYILKHCLQYLEAKKPSQKFEKPKDN